MITYLGLDLSLTETGWAMAGPDLREPSSGVWKCPDSIKGVRRLGWLHDHLLPVLSQKRPMVIAIEDYAMAATGRVFHLGEWGGIARLMCYQRTQPTVALTVPPTTLKMFATNNGNADKARMVACATTLFGEHTKNHNRADAMALACVACAWNENKEFSRRQDEAMSKVFPCFPLGFRPAYKQEPTGSA